MSDPKALNRTQRAELQALRDNQQRLICFDGGAELMPWEAAHRHHRGEPYIGCLFCREEFVPLSRAVEAEALAARYREALERIADAENAEKADPGDWAVWAHETARDVLDIRDLTASEARRVLSTERLEGGDVL